MQRKQPNHTFHPVASYRDVYIILERKRFREKLKAHYIADPDDTCATFHVLGSNRRHTAYAQWTALKQLQADTNRLRIAN